MTLAIRTFSVLTSFLFSSYVSFSSFSESYSKLSLCISVGVNDHWDEVAKCSAFNFSCEELNWNYFNCCVGHVFQVKDVSHIEKYTKGRWPKLD